MPSNDPSAIAIRDFANAIAALPKPQVVRRCDIQTYGKTARCTYCGASAELKTIGGHPEALPGKLCMQLAREGAFSASLLRADIAGTTAGVNRGPRRADKRAAQIALLLAGCAIGYLILRMVIL